ncbi:hypothetical protein Tco_0375135 [Tanacetum coccineum]
MITLMNLGNDILISSPSCGQSGKQSLPKSAHDSPHFPYRTCPIWTFVAKVNDEGESSIIILYLSELFTFNLWTDIKNLSKDFSIYYALLVGQKEFIRLCVFDLLNSVPELLHKDFMDFCKDSECLEAHGVLDHINDDLKCFFLLMHSGFQSNIGRVYSVDGTHFSSRAITC